MKPILSAFRALAFVTAIAAPTGAEDWSVKTFLAASGERPQLNPKASPSQPDYRVVSQGTEIGAAWIRTV